LTPHALRVPAIRRPIDDESAEEMFLRLFDQVRAEPVIP